MVSMEVLEKDLKSGNLKSLYLLYGEELFLLESLYKKIRSLFGEGIKGINDIVLDETNYQSLVANMETPAFGFEKKLIVVRNTGLFQKEGKSKNKEMSKIKNGINQYLQENIDMVRSNLVIIFIEQEVDVNQELYQTIDQLGIVCKFDFQKPIQIEKRMKAICQAYQVQVEEDTLRYFLECCGTNMQELINEIRKLIEHAGKGGMITKKDIDQLCTKQIQAVIFDLTDNLGKKKIGKALEVLHQLIYDKEPIQKILITLYHHFKKLYLVSLAQKYQKDVGSVLNLKPNQQFLVGKYRAQANCFQEKELREILGALIDLDANYKVGLIDIEIGLEAILCRYCS